jgi:hypothetical protein
MKYVTYVKYVIRYLHYSLSHPRARPFANRKITYFTDGDGKIMEMENHVLHILRLPCFRHQVLLGST